MFASGKREGRGTPGAGPGEPDEMEVERGRPRRAGRGGRESREGGGVGAWEVMRGGRDEGGGGGDMTASMRGESVVQRVWVRLTALCATAVSPRPSAPPPSLLREGMPARETDSVPSFHRDQCIRWLIRLPC